jgi:hypothetical protein
LLYSASVFHSNGYGCEFSSFLLYLGSWAFYASIFSKYGDSKVPFLLEPMLLIWILFV